MSKINFQFQGHKFFQPMERKPVSKSIKLFARDVKGFYQLVSRLGRN